MIEHIRKPRPTSVTPKKKSRAQVVQDCRHLAEQAYKYECLLASINEQASAAVDVHIVIPGAGRFVDALKEIKGKTEPFATAIQEDIAQFKTANPVELTDEHGNPKEVESEPDRKPDPDSGE